MARLDMSEAWICNECDWTGDRSNCDSHVRAARHSVSPKPVLRPCPNCGQTINAGSLWCRHCRTTVTRAE